MPGDRGATWQTSHGAAWAPDMEASSRRNLVSIAPAHGLGTILRFKTADLDAYVEPRKTEPQRPA